MNEQETGTIMQNAPGDPTVTRSDNMDFGATEPDNTSLYQPKGEYRTSNMPRFTLPPNVYGPVRNLAVVYMTESASTIDRRRSLDQLITMADNGDEMARAVLDALIENMDGN